MLGIINKGLLLFLYSFGIIKNMKLPSKIYTQFGDSFNIQSYEDGAFILEENPFFYSYLVDSNGFTIMKNGMLFPSGVKAMSHETYLRWKNRFDEKSK